MFFHRGRTVHDVFSDAPELLINVSNMFRLLPLFSTEQLQTIFDLVLSTLPGEEVLMEERSTKLWNLTLRHAVKSLNKEDASAGRVRYSLTKEVL